MASNNLEGKLWAHEQKSESTEDKGKLVLTGFVMVDGKRRQVKIFRTPKKYQNLSDKSPFGNIVIK